MKNLIEKYGITVNFFKDVCFSSSSAAEAARILKLNFNTFKRLALKYNCYKTNQSGKGTTKKSVRKIQLDDVLNNKVFYQTYKLKKLLFENHIFEDKCQLCGWDKKRNEEKYSPCELHHIDGNPYNNSLDNLQILCPNCHSLTDNYRAKNIKKI